MCIILNTPFAGSLPLKDLVLAACMDVASYISYCRYKVIESSSLVSVLFIEVLAIPTSFFSFTIINGFYVTSSKEFSLANCYELFISSVHV